jgi:hypothetical protein
VLIHLRRAKPRLEMNAAPGLPRPTLRPPARQAAGRLPSPAPGVAEARLALLRAEYARLVAAARASITAARAGAPDPLVYLEAELARHGGLPPQDATVPAVLADAGTAMVLAGRAARPHEPMAVAS